MIDGRPITSSPAAGVFWGANNIPLSIVKRIEVVRGAWTSLWGGDSFTGVINVITKPASETQDWQSITVAGTSGIDQTVRKGGTVGETGHYRIYTKAGYKTGNSFFSSMGVGSSNDWMRGRTGFRVDWNNAFTDELSIQGDIGGSRIDEGASGTHQIYEPHQKEAVLGYGQLTWDRATGLDAGIRFRTSFTHEKESIGDMSGTVKTWDMELQYAAEQAGVHLITCGIGSKYYWDSFVDGPYVTIDKQTANTFDSNAFIQDKITISPESLYLILGSKFDYFGAGALEVQPTVRLLHTRMNEEYWLAVSRSARAESRWQKGGSYTIMQHGIVYTVVAPSHLNSEKMVSYEAGYRRSFSKDLRLDVSFYLNDYDKLIMLKFDDVSKTATLTNSLKGMAYGTEVGFDWKAANWLTLRPSVSMIYQRIDGNDSHPRGDSMPEGGTEGELKLQILTVPTEKVGFDVFAGYVNNPTQKKIPGYFTLDAHTSWQIESNVMLELTGKNLLEANEQFSPRKEGPTIDLRVTWDF